MTDSEKMDIILENMQDMRSEMRDMRPEIQDIKSQMQDMKLQINNLELHIENCTDKNITLVAENFVDLTRKLNQAIPATDNRLAYEVKVNYLMDELEKLKKQVADLRAELKDKIA